MSTISLTSTIQQRASIQAAELSPTESVMLDIEKGSYYGAEAVSKRIWEQLVEPISVSSICDALLAEYEVDRATCESQTLAYLQQLADAELITVSE